MRNSPFARFVTPPFVRAVCLSLSGLGVLLLALSCKRSTPSTTDVPTEAPPGWFEDATEASGLQFTQDAGPTAKYFMPQSMGTGVAVFDLDGDGLHDVYLLNFGGPGSTATNRLFRQTARNQFTDISAGSGTDLAGHFHGVAVGDMNNDGRPDLVLNGYGTLKLLLNQGSGKFADVTKAAGLSNLGWGTSLALFDYDRDGWLDLLALNYLDYDPKMECKAPDGALDYCGPNSFTGTTSKLFRNLGQASPKFEDVSLASGIGKLRGPGLGVTVADFDGDHWPDVFVSNDGQANRLWMNQKNGTFVDEAVSRGAALTAMGKAYAGMGIAIGDIDGDGMVDLYVAHLNTEQNNLWRQGPRGQFRDRTADVGLASTKWRGTGFGTLMADFNLDGHLDITVANGKVARSGTRPSAPHLGFWETYAEKNQLFVNDGQGKFKDVSAENAVLCGFWNVGRGLACADIDNDGAPDLLMSPTGDRARYFRNVAPDRGHWLQVQAIDPQLNRDALGAEIRVRAGGKEYVRLVNPSESYLSSSSPIVHFGLGSNTTIEAIRITWPNGSTATEVFPGGAADRRLVLKRGTGNAP